MLLALRHHAIVSRDRKEHQIDAVGARQHVPDKSLVTGNVDDPGASAIGQGEIRESEIDRDAALLFLLQAVGILARERLDQSGLAMIDMTGGADNRVCY